MGYKVGDEVLVKAEVTDLHEGLERPYFLYSYHLGWVSEDEIASKTYEQGLADAWELAKKILYSLTRAKLEDIFGTDNESRIIDTHTPEEALAKIEAYEKEKEIKEGMIVVFAEEKWIVAEIKEDMLKLWNGKEILEARKSSCEPTKGVVEVSNVLGR